MPITTCLMIFGAHMNILSVFKAKILVLNKQSCRSLQSCSWLSNLQWLAYFEHASQSHSKHMMFSWCLFLDPRLTTYHSKVSRLLQCWNHAHLLYHFWPLDGIVNWLIHLAIVNHEEYHFLSSVMMQNL